MQFLKMQACGNDFVIIDQMAGTPAGLKISPALAIQICDRHFGVGCDQLLWLKPSRDFSALVEIFNADGSVAEMCGNGMRAIGVYLAKSGPAPGLADYAVRTEAGSASRTVAIDLRGEFPEVALGRPTVSRLDEKIAPYGAFSRVDIGNPHAVFFVSSAEALTAIDLEHDGPAIETHSLFPNRTNVEFVAVLDRRRVSVRVWERGAGATLACGSGACAVVVAAEARGLVDAGERIEVVLQGGSVFVRLVAGEALLSGPVGEVFEGEWRALR